MPRTYTKFVPTVHVKGEKPQVLEGQKRRREAIRHALVIVLGGGRWARNERRVRAVVREVDAGPWASKERPKVVWRAERLGKRLRTWETIE